jgi:hypothetical protein
MTARWTGTSASRSAVLLIDLLALSVNKVLTQVPMEFENIPIGQKPKQGRKPKALPVLKRQFSFKLFLVYFN